MKTMLLCIAIIATLLIAGAKSTSPKAVHMVSTPAPMATVEQPDAPMVTKSNVINTNAK